MAAPGGARQGRPGRRGGGILRRLRQSARARAVLARIGAGYIALAKRTIRWDREGTEGLDSALADGRGMIAAIWHGRLFFSPTWAPPGRQTLAMISNNSDGELIAAIVERFGVIPIRGSTFDKAKRRDKGGSEVARAALDGLEGGAMVAITPDGPRGPRMRAQAGVARLAVQAQAKVVPVAFSVRRGWLAPSWDRFLVPWIWGRGAEIYGPVLTPPPDGDPAAEARFLAEIERALTEVTQEADRRCGRAPVEPESQVEAQAGSPAPAGAREAPGPV